jgi:NAD(P)-dependent dehydrogenase (short-subunit alcohol dehydrogenase family)
MTRILIIGASSGIGLETARLALTKGFAVRALICPQKVVQLNVSLRHDCLPSSKRPAKLVWVAQPGAAA